jgi:hypothetical protein
MSTPVKRGPPQPKPGPKKAATSKAPPAVTLAIPAPETKTKPAPEARPPEESKAAKE